MKCILMKNLNDTKRLKCWDRDQSNFINKSWAAFYGWGCEVIFISRETCCFFIGGQFFFTLFAFIHSHLSLLILSTLSSLILSFSLCLAFPLLLLMLSFSLFLHLSLSLLFISVYIHYFVSFPLFLFILFLIFFLFHFDSTFSSFLHTLSTIILPFLILILPHIFISLHLKWFFSWFCLKFSLNLSS